MINQMFALETFHMDNVIIQQVRIFWIFTFGVSHALLDGEHFSVLLAAGPIQFDVTIRYWKHDQTIEEKQ